MSLCLVTGAAGFIGSHVARHCLASGHEVVAFDDLSGGFRRNVPEGAQFVQGSVSSLQDVERLFAMHTFDYVYHLAAYAAEGLSHFIRRFNYTNNVLGSVNLINACVNSGVRCFVFTSSIAVYGAAQSPMEETRTPEPEDPYGIAKYAVELDLVAANKMFGLDFVIFRPHNVYGEGQNIADRYRNVIGIFMNQIMRGEELTIFGDGEQTRAFTHVDDVAPIIARAPETKGAANAIFNVGADEPHSVNHLATVIAECFGAAPRIVRLPARREVVHAFSSHARVREVFGRKTSVPLEEGVARMARWATTWGPQEPSRFGEIEIAKSLPAGWS